MKVAHFLSLNHPVNVTVSYQPQDSAGKVNTGAREEIWGHAFLVKMKSDGSLKLRYLQMCTCSKTLPHIIAHCFILGV